MSKRLPKAKVKGKTYWIHKCDEAMSLLVREKGQCERCGSTYNMLNHAHVWGRANKTLRWDILNAMCLCVTCHFWWHEYPTESGLWFKEKYPDRYEYLSWAKNEYTNRTEADYAILLDDIKNKRLDKLTLPINTS